MKNKLVMKLRMNVEKTFRNIYRVVFIYKYVCMSMSVD